MSLRFRRHASAALLLWRHHRAQALLSMLGAAAGVAGLVAVMAIGDGAEREMNRALALLGAGTLVIRASGEEPGRPRIGADRVAALERLLGREVKTPVPVVSSRREVGSAAATAGTVRVLGTTMAYGAAYRLQLHVGRFISGYDVERRAPVCVLGWALGRQLFPRGEPLGQAVRVGPRWCTVIGWLRGAGQLDVAGSGIELPDFDQALYLPLTVAGDADKLRLDELVVRFANEGDMLRAVPAVRRIVEYGVDAPAFEYLMPVNLLRQKFRMQRVMRNLLAGVTGIMLVVGGLGIMNVMHVNVLRRRAEIGLRRAVGASRRDIITQFVTESTLITMAGGLAGVALGVAASLLLSAWVGWPVSVGLDAVVAGLVVSGLLGMFSGTYPALQAASVAPMQALNQ